MTGEGSSTTQKTVLRRTDIGVGVFSVADIAAGETIEWCPVVMMPADRVRGTHLAQYVSIGFNDDGSVNSGLAAVVLGWGMLFNHSFTPNANNRYHYDLRLMEYYATDPIAAGDEVRIDYSYALADTFHDPQRQWYVDAYCSHHGVTRQDVARQCADGGRPVTGLAYGMRRLLGLDRS